MCRISQTWIFCKGIIIKTISQSISRKQVWRKVHKSPCHENILGSGGIVPHILDLSPKWRWVVSFTSWPLYPQGNNPLYPLDRRLGGPQSHSGHGGEEKNSQPSPGIKPQKPNRPAWKNANLTLSWCKIWGFHSSEDSHWCLLVTTQRTSMVILSCYICV
jgi:hypothetical protein